MKKVRDYFNSRDLMYHVLTVTTVKEEKSVVLMLKNLRKYEKNQC